MTPGKQKNHSAVIVTRVSTGEQKKSGTSLEDQLDKCRAKALALGLPIANEYEEAVSGGLFLTRHGMQAALTDMREGRADTLICATIDRYSRDAEYQQRIKKEVRAAGGRLVICDMDFADTPEGDLAFGTFGNFAQYERQRIRRQTIDGKLRRVGQGTQPCRGYWAFGYRVVTKLEVLRGEQPEGSEGHYLIVEEEASWARELFARYAVGASLTGLGRWLQESGVIPIQGAMVWHANTLAGILRNPLYRGCATYGEKRRQVDEGRLEQGHPRIDYGVKVPEEEWHYIPAPALVDEATWAQCQVRLRDNQARLSGNNQRRHVLTGLLKCPACGRSMRSKKTRGYCHFHCRDYSVRCNLSGVVCHARHYNSIQLETLAADALTRTATEPEVLEKAIRAYESRLAPQDRGMERASLGESLAALDTEQAAVVTAQIRGVQAGADLSAYDDAFADIAARRVSLKARLAAIPDAASGPILSPSEIAEEVGRRVERLGEVLRAPELPAAERHELLAAVVVSMVPTAGDDSEGEEGIEVVLKAPFGQTGQSVRRIVTRC